MSSSSDIALETVGLRPGERLREQLLMETEEMLLSEHEKIFIAHGRPFDRVGFREDLDALRVLVHDTNQEGALEQLAAMAHRY